MRTIQTLEPLWGSEKVESWATHELSLAVLAGRASGSRMGTQPE